MFAHYFRLFDNIVSLHLLTSLHLFFFIASICLSMWTEYVSSSFFPDSCFYSFRVHLSFISFIFSFVSLSFLLFFVFSIYSPVLVLIFSYLSLLLQFPFVFHYIWYLIIVVDLLFISVMLLSLFYKDWNLGFHLKFDNVLPDLVRACFLFEKHLVSLNFKVNLNSASYHSLVTFGTDFIYDGIVSNYKINFSFCFLI